MIFNYLRKEHCILDLKSATKEGAIKEIARCLSQCGEEVVDKDIFVTEILKREKLGSTGIGFHLAIPHARTKAVKGFVIGVGRSKKGIDFDAVDKEKVNLIFVMGANPKELNQYLRMLAQLSRLIMDKSFRKKIMEAGTPAEVIRAFQGFEDVFNSAK
jgi:fructose-specific phosphotransferase system IIA component